MSILETTTDISMVSQNLSTLPTFIQNSTHNNFYRTADQYNVFEFYAMDISQTFNVAPSFIPAIAGGQFTDVSAVAIINVSANNFSKLFKFKSDDTIDSTDWAIPNVSLNNMKFGCYDQNAFNGILYSNASVTVGLANSTVEYVNNTTIKQDFVRHLAKSITGGYAMSEIFTNEQQLVQGVADMNAPFNASMSQILVNSKTGTYANNIAGDDSQYLYSEEHVKDDPVALSCQNLVANLFALNVSVKNGVTYGNASSWQRGQLFLNDLAEQSQSNVSDNAFYVKFRNTDVLALRFTYAPFGSTNGVDDNSNITQSAPGYNRVNSRSYKVYLVMKE